MCTFLFKNNFFLNWQYKSHRVSIILSEFEKLENELWILEQFIRVYTFELKRKPKSVCALILQRGGANV